MIGKLKNKFTVTCFAMGMLLISYTRVSAAEIKEDKNPVEIKADSVEWDNKNNIATAQGNVLIKMGEDTLQGDKIVFNIENKTGVAYEGRAFYARNHFYIKGDKIEKTGEQTYFIQQPRATTCDGDSPDWEIAGSEMDVTIEGYGLMKNARFLTKGLPVFYSPFVPFPAKTKRQSGFLMPYLSYSKDKDGVDIEIPYFWAISPQMDATFYQRYIEKRGFKEGAEFRYYLGNNSFGTFYGDYLEDRKQVTETIDAATSRDWQDMHQRWSYYFNHQTNFDPQFYVRTDLQKVSDKWYFKDFSAHNYYLDNYAQTEEDPFKKVPFYGDQSLRSLESTARVYKGWSNYNLIGLISSTDDFAAANNNLTLQKYPEIVITGIKQPLLKTPLYYELTGTYDYFYSGENQKGHYADFAPKLTLPFDISHYAKVIPQLTLKETFWSRDDAAVNDSNRIGNRTIYNAAVTATSQISRVFDINMQNWDKVRHEIKPEITYSYIPNVNQDNIPNYLPTMTNALTPLTFVSTPVASALTPAIPSSPTPIAGQNAVGWSLTNTFTAKMKDQAGVYSYLEFLRLKFFQVYDAAASSPAGDIGMELDFRPYKYFSFSARNQYSVNSGWTVTNYDLTVSDWRSDMLTVGYRYTRDSIEQITVGLKAKITNNITGNFVSSRDLLNSRTVENTVGLLYHRQCWSLGFDYTQTDTDNRFLLKISLAGLGGWGL